MPRLLFFAGSARKDSLNKKLAQLASAIAWDSGAQVTLIDLADFPMPLYDGDCEAEKGLPETAKQLKKLFAEHDGFFIASPEYNGSFSPLLKNAIDWTSRAEKDGEEPLTAFKGKTVALGAVSPGGMGGRRGLVMLRDLFGNINVEVTPTQVAVPKGFDAFDDDDKLVDAQLNDILSATVRELIDAVKKRQAA